MSLTAVVTLNKTCSK